MLRIVLLIILSLLTILSSKELEKVSLQLDWKYQFQFAGFIIAKEKGYYKDFGLDVELREFKSGLNVLDEVKSGRSTFTTYDLALLQLLDKKNPIKIVANYFKRTALVFIAKQDILTPHDLKNKKIMIDKIQLESSSLGALLKKFNIKKDEYTLKPYNFSTEDFINDKVDAISAYLSNELYYIQKAKKRYTILDPASYGIYALAQNVFATKKTTEKNPQMVQNFINASNMGWLYALRNKKEVVDLIYEKYSKIKSKEALLFEAEQVEKFIMPHIYKIGEVNKFLLQKNINDLYPRTFSTKFNIEDLIFKYRNNEKHKLNFTDKEKQYIDRKKEITMCIDPNWMPYEKILSNGKYIGMTSEYIPMLSKKIEIPIKLITTKDWSESISFAKQRKCDILSLAMPTPSRLKYMNFTIPYITFPLVLTTKMDKPFVANPETLITKKKVGVVREYAIGKHLKNKYPNNKIIEFNSVEEGMEMLQKGKIYAFIGALPTIGYILQHKYIGELKIAGQFEQQLELGVAVRNDDLILLELFEKAIQSIDEMKKQEILNKYISIKVESGFDYTLLYQILPFIFIIAAFGFYRHRQILKYNSELETNQKQLELTQEKLEISIESFKILLDSVLEAIFVFEKRVCVDINSVAIKMFGYANKEEVLGKKIQEFITKRSYKEVLKRVKSKDASSYEIIALKKDETQFSVLIKETKLVINSKKVKILTVLDISDMKKKEKLLSQQSKMASMGQMLENIAHQWRQPLSLISTISTSLELKKQLDLTTKEEDIEGLKKINETSQHLSQTIEDFRDFFKGNKEKAEFSVLETIEKSLALLEGTLKNNEIEVIFENKEDVIINNLQNEFIQALINIFYNAKDALNKKNERFVFINLKKDNNFIKISIKDNGGGVNKNIIEKIFDPYFTTKHQSQGTGIGLYMTHQIIEKHMNGTITVENSFHKYKNKKYYGAEFIIKLSL